MSDLRLSPPRARMVAVAAAVVASLGLVALGVQIGTNGLVGDGPGRNPGSSTATPASATVDLARTRGTASIDQIVLSIVPAAGAGAFGSGSASQTTPGPDSSTGPVSGGGDSGPPSAPPTSPPPTPPVAPLPPTPVPVPPSPLAPVVDPLVDVVEGVGGSAAGAAAPVAPGPASSLEGLVQKLLGV